MTVALRLDKPWSNLDFDALARHNALMGRKDFWAFRQIVNPGMVKGWWQREVAREFQQFKCDYIAGKRPKLVLQSPPQHGKSIQVNDLIADIAGTVPTTKIIYASFSDRLGVRANLRLQRMLDTTAYQRVYGQRITPRGTRMSGAAATRNRDILEFVDDDLEPTEGYFRNTTVMGSVTGEGLDLGVIDDPLKGRAEASSKTIRDKTWDWLTDDFMTRFSDNAAMLMILTRWHIDDPAGRMAEVYPDLRVLRYPAIATEDEKFRNKGEPLFPELKSHEFLLKQKAPMTQAGWESVYQQNPIVVGGGLFPIEKFGIPLLIKPDKKEIRKSVRYWDKAGCLTKGTMVTTIRGQVPIEQVLEGELVLTQNGYKRVKKSWMSGYAETLTSVIFSDGSTVTGTPDHPVYVAGGYWIELGNLIHSDKVLHKSEIDQWRGPEIQISRKSSLRGDDTLDSLVVDTTIAMSGTKLQRSTFTSPCIEKCGSQFMGRYPMAAISTTRTRTGITTQSKILNVLRRQSTINYTAGRQSSEPRCENGLEKMVLECEQQHCLLFKSQSTMFAQRVVNDLELEVSKPSIAGVLHVGGSVGTLLLKRGVPVYDLTVEDSHAFFANGILVHNTTDGGAYTAGVLMHELRDGRFVVSDVRRFQKSAFDREVIIKQTCVADNADGWTVDTWVEQEPGSGGKESAERTVVNLAGFNVYKDKVRGNKELRADPYAAQQQAGNVRLVQGKWNRDFLDEHEAFPNGKYKDQVDAAGGAFVKLVDRLFDEQMEIGLPVFGGGTA